MATSQKLVDVLKAKIAEGQEEKLLRGVEKEVKKAKMAGDQEIYQLELVKENCEEHLEAILERPTSTLEAIVTAQRQLKLASENLKEAKKVYSERF